MRKYQIETYRREVPDGGYVVSVVRDVPSCSMGFIDYLGHPKWSAADWSWHGDTMLLLETEADRRSFAAGETFRATPLISHFGPRESRMPDSRSPYRHPKRTSCCLSRQFARTSRWMSVDSADWNRWSWHCPPSHGPSGSL